MDLDGDNRLQAEAECFDKQIIDRVNHGHIPDLRNKERCHYFYNNVWRDPLYTSWVFGATHSNICECINKHIKKEPAKINILEVGCGPGHISLELSRNGYNVTGIDISNESIQIARKTAVENPSKENCGRVEYRISSLFEIEDNRKYDLVVFVGSFDHFPDLSAVMKKICTVLLPDGYLYVSEPCSIPLNDSDASIIFTIRLLLSVGGMYYENIKIPETETELSSELEKIKNEFAYMDEMGEKTQSPNDRGADFTEMYKYINKYFNDLFLNKDYTFFNRVVAGLRFTEIEKEHIMAKFIYDIDKLLTKDMAITPGHFNYFGKMRNE